MQDVTSAQNSAIDLDLTIDERVFSAPGAGEVEEIIDGQNLAATFGCTFKTTCWTCTFTCGDCGTVGC